MKAVTIVSFGGVEGLEIREVPNAPPATLDRVRVRVRAAGLNRADILQRLGRYPAPPGYPQDIPGIEFAGEVEQVGEEGGQRDCVKPKAGFDDKRVVERKGEGKQPFPQD